jgi:hypothetical protein
VLLATLGLLIHLSLLVHSLFVASFFVQNVGERLPVQDVISKVRVVGCSVLLTVKLVILFDKLALSKVIKVGAVQHLSKLEVAMTLMVSSFVCS